MMIPKGEPTIVELLQEEKESIKLALETFDALASTEAANASRQAIESVLNIQREAINNVASIQKEMYLRGYNL